MTDTVARETDPAAAGDPPDNDSVPAGTESRLARLRRQLTNTRLARLLEVLALLPMVTTLLEVTAGQRLQYTDYWYVLLRITNPDGSLHIAGMRVLQNEHPLMLPSFLYWLDARFAGGDNRILGVLVVIIAAVTVLLLRTALPKTLPPPLRAGIVVAASALVFSPHGLHNFVRAMSGSAWLTANLLVIGALLLAYHRKWWLAWALGLLACMSYGTAFAVWPAFALMATINRESWWKRLLPLGVGLIVVLSWLGLKPAVDPGGAPANDLASLLYTLLAVIGHLWTADTAGVAVFAGVVVLGLYGWLATTTVGRDRSMRFWWALACHAFVASAMIAAARIDFGADFGLSSRYTSLSVLMAVPAVVLLMVWAHRVLGERAQKLAIGVLAIGLLGYTLGSPAAATIRSQNSEHQLEAIALRAGLGDAYGATLPPAKALVPRLEAMGHYPFSDAFTLGCGGPELGSTLDMNAMTPLPPADERNPRQPAGSVDDVENKNDGAVIRGWATGVDDPVRCAVVVDANGKITGGGLTHLSRRDVTARLSGISADVGFSVIAPASAANRVVIILESGSMRWISAEAPDSGK
ncbi:MAG: hypothetical protein GEV28_13550 [Actinophytocola sp.]|uniref:hypothetical protein n=1 Tax=Actinophytocola sp. TaxID=1872138 RepID=UPI0013244B0B|nr:hypothetical protein [Actinophytocola sp.]MPZ81362.1 hypothetical protein [Actinophytocola sp.]